ncbi:MAG: M81 family metallopeptidase [Candidatus Rokubacteria bacterium]|nr:M81 family metallopeptidase [Candidatus Rokubacteria bacterium]
MRFFIAMFAHETNTFSTLPTDRRQFEARALRYGGEILEAYRGTGTCLGGMIDAAAARGVTLVPSLAAAASPAGRVSADFYEQTKARLLADLRAAAPLDGVLLDLHGAMVPEAAEDGEGDLLRAVRAALGPAVPVGVTLDFHANVSADMVAHATLLHGYKTYPHVDMDARGREAAERLADVAAGRLRPAVAWRQTPLLPPIAGQLTARGPMRRLSDLADGMEHDPRVVSVSVFAGFPLADIRDAGLSVYVATDGDRPLAERLADELARTAWEHRREFLHTALPVEAAVAKALAAAGRPVVLADIADNTGGGAAGDTTEVLRELLRVGARGVTVACVWDPAAVAACARAGVGATVTVEVGGKVDPSHGAPVPVTGRVRTLSDGRFVHRGPMFRGLEGRLGPTAVLDVNDLKIVLISYRWQTLDPEMIRFVGIDPAAERILVVKSSVHYRAAFEPIAHEVIEVDAPGLSSSNLARFSFKHVRRPIFPLDEL